MSGLLLLLCLALPASAGPPKVVVSIAPLHSLVAGVMQGIAEPALLIDPGQSPHQNSLRPSQRRKLANAGLLVWVGPAFETSLAKAARQQPETELLTLLDTRAVERLPARESSIWTQGPDAEGEAHAHAEEADHEEHEEHKAHTHGQYDPHIWLSTRNAAAIVAQVSERLSRIDAENAARYRANATRLLGQIEKTRATLQQRLEPVRGTPFLVFHDAYQYFEVEQQLHPVAAVTLSPERKPGARSLLALTRAIEDSEAKCIFREPQFVPDLVQRIAEQTEIRVGVLDPVGSALVPGPALWFALLESLADALLGCLVDT